MRQQSGAGTRNQHDVPRGPGGGGAGRKHADGTLQLVPGGYREAVEHVADLWAERRAANAQDPDYRLTIIGTDQCRCAGDRRGDPRTPAGHGPARADKVTLPAIDQLASRMSCRSRSAIGCGCSRTTQAAMWPAAAAASSAERLGAHVLAVDADGITLRNAHGTEGLVTWDTLRDRATGRIKLTYGDVLTISSSQGVTASEHIDAMPSGTQGRHRLRRLRRGEPAPAAATWSRPTVPSGRKSWRAARSAILGRSPRRTCWPTWRATSPASRRRRVRSLSWRQPASASVPAPVVFSVVFVPLKNASVPASTRNTMHWTFARNRLRAAAAQLHQLADRIKPAIEAHHSP